MHGLLRITRFGLGHAAQPQCHDAVRRVLQDFEDQFRRLAGQSATIGHGQGIGILQHHFLVFAGQRIGFGEGVGSLPVAFHVIVGTAQHEPAPGIVRLFLEVPLQFGDHGIDIYLGRLFRVLNLRLVQGIGLTQMQVGQDRKQWQQQDNDDHHPASLRDFLFRRRFTAEVIYKGRFQFLVLFVELLSGQHARRQLLLQVCGTVPDDFDIALLRIGFLDFSFFP